MRPERFAQIKATAMVEGKGPKGLWSEEVAEQYDRIIHDLTVELARENAAHFQDVAWECDRRVDPSTPTEWPCRQPVTALVIDREGGIISSWCDTDLPAGTPEEWIIRRLVPAAMADGHLEGRVSS
jgi:hypothetical protein